MPVSLTIGADDDGRRLDRLLRKYLAALPLSAIHRLLRTGRILVDGKKAAPADRLRSGSILTLPDSAASATADRAPASSSRKAAQDAMSPKSSVPLPSFQVVWEDADLLVVVKDAGILVHGDGRLEEAVLEKLRGKLEPSLSFKPGPLHRLDRGTSGLVAFSVSIRGARVFSEALRSRRIRKRYLAILEGVLSGVEEWTDELERDGDARTTRVVARKTAVSTPVETAVETGAERNEGTTKTATTRAMSLAQEGGRTLALVEIGTGRTHQIRSQAAARKHPLLGDVKYGGSFADGGFFLHAYELAIPEGLGLNLPPFLIAAPPSRFLRRAADLFGEETIRALADRMPTDSLGPASHA